MMWELRFYETDSKGKRQRKTETVGALDDYPSEAAVRKAPAVQALLLRINAESPISGKGPSTFGAVLARYEKEELPERHSTRTSYQSYIKKHIRPRWENALLPNIKPMALEDWLKGLKLAPKTRSHIRSLMHTIFQCALRWELTDRNPVALVRVKGGSKRLEAPRVLTPEEFCLIPEVLPEPYRTQVWIAGCLGLRASEIMPLKWQDFDFKNGTLLVQRGAVHGRIADTKTEYSADVVPLDEDLVKIILQHKKNCPTTSEGWVFANPKTGKPYHQDSIQQNYIRQTAIGAKLGDGVGWHTFRHSYRSWMDDTGAPITVQKELMRHASIQTTMNVYGKAMTDSKRQAHSKVVAMVLRGSKPRNEPALAATGS
jgi:integrase